MAQLSVNKEVCIGSFLQLSDSAKACYFVLLLLADRAGFCDKAIILRVSGDYADSALKELVTSGFIVDIEDVLVIRHWYLHDANRKTNNPTMFTEIRDRLVIKDWIYDLKGVKHVAKGSFGDQSNLK